MASARDYIPFDGNIINLLLSGQFLAQPPQEAHPAGALFTMCS